jgi:nitrilase
MDQEKKSVVRVAVVQAGSVPWDRAASVDRLDRWAREAAAAGAELVVFPEAFIGGYPKGMDFGVTVGRRTEEGRRQFARYAAGAIEDPAGLAAVAAAHGVWLVVGAIEREGGTLYCTVFYLAPDGTVAGKHRKVMPTAMERLIWGAGDGSTLGVVQTPMGRVGTAICWENYMPQLRLALYGQGVELYCAPTVDDRETWLPTMRHIAMEGRCFVLSACQWQPPGEWSAITGGSVIVDPMGQVLAGPKRDGEGLLVADLEMERIREAQFDLDVVGHYGRPDLFQLTVNTHVQRSVAED